MITIRLLFPHPWLSRLYSDIVSVGCGGNELRNSDTKQRVIADETSKSKKNVRCEDRTRDLRIALTK